MAVRLPYPYPDPITGEWDVFAMIRNLQVIAQNQYSANSVTPTTVGGTGLTAYVTGDLLYSSATNVLSRRPIGTAGDVLTVSGGLPAWVPPVAPSLTLQALNTATVGASTTVYSGPGVSTPVATEANVAAVIPRAGTLKSFYVRTTAAQPASGSMVATVRKNATNSPVTVTIAAGAAAGNFSDTTHSTSLTTGDRITVQFVNNATAASSGVASYAFVVFTSATP